MMTTDECFLVFPDATINLPPSWEDTMVFGHSGHLSREEELSPPGITGIVLPLNLSCCINNDKNNINVLDMSDMTNKIWIFDGEKISQMRSSLMKQKVKTRNFKPETQKRVGFIIMNPGIVYTKPVVSQ